MMQIRFCFEIEHFDKNAYSFVVNRPTSIKLLEMSSSSTSNDIGLFIGSLLSFNELSLNSKFVDSLFIKNELALVGGLLFKTDRIVIGASCCADFQDWLDVTKSIKQKISPWMGHDPSPWFEFENEKITLWGDRNKSNNCNSIQFTQQEFDRQLLEANKELHYFLERVEQWTVKNYNIDSKRLVSGVKKYLLI